MARRSTPRERRKVLDALDVPEQFREARSLPPKRPVGRPSKYSLELAMEICRRLGSGELAIDICAEEGMPSVSTLYDWEVAHPEFSQLYARARVQQAHACAERAIRSGRAAHGDQAAAARVQFDADRWFASKLLAKVYGDKLDVNHAGKVDVRKLSEAEVDERLADVFQETGIAGGGGVETRPVVPPRPDGVVH